MCDDKRLMLRSYGILGTKVRPVHIQSKETTVLKKLLRKFNKVELLNDIPRLCYVSYEQNHVSHLKKEELIEDVACLIQEGSENIADIISLLKLKYLQVHSRSKYWSSLNVVNATNLVTTSTDPHTFAQALEKLLNRSQFFCNVTCLYSKGAMWTIIVFKKPKSEQCTYLLNYADIPIVLYCGLLKSHHVTVNKTLKQLFHGTDIVHIPIKTRDINCLLHLSLRKSEKHFVPSSYPLVVQKALKKRKAEEEPELPVNLINEDSLELSKTKSYLMENFGSYEQPPLEVLTYHVKTECFGIPDDGTPHSSFNCRVVFKGKNVLEGFQQLVKAGALKCPIPDFFLSVPYSGSNTFHLTKKRIRTDNFLSS